MGELHYIDLRVTSRDDSEASEDESLCLLFGEEEVAAFPAPAPGEARGLGESVSLPLSEGARMPVALRVRGPRPWAPREAIVSAQYSADGGRPRTYAVAVARPRFDDPSGAGAFVSDDAPDAMSHLPLARFREATETELLDQFLLVVATDRAHATTRGRLELTLRASLGGVPAVVFQTVLPRVGRQEPGQQGGYLYRFQIPSPGVPFALIHSVSISNRSDDAWGVAGAELYGWRVNENGEPVGGLISDGPSQRVVSQDVADRFPEPSPELHLESGWQKSGTSDTYAFELFDRPLALP